MVTTKKKDTGYAQSAGEQQPSRRALVSAGWFFAILAAIAAAALGFTAEHRQTAWLVILALMVLFVVLFGYAATGNFQGVLIDRRNRVSLSRLQMLSWSLLALSGLLTAALTNLLTYESATPLNIDIPSSLWVLMGISSASLVGSPAITASKEQEAKDTIDINGSPSDAKWSDLFLSEEKGSTGVVDIGKLQMFFFTFILVLTYGAAIGGKLVPDAGVIDAFPPVDEGVNVLLGISHTSYLATKAMAKQQPGKNANEEGKQ